ncbi:MULTISPECIES: C4-type zinc ribbon domain-containing protein [unclassified Mucilaginibacter]|uniref:zinc ribbon domain-containing protein n=1 Tax=unclassified Mucilaginibacter TaxID=2617802 RepID=UPI002AC9A409|nr:MULTISPECIES: C4-type zinc ribbon domain-containing protein [unclassified Mucilaginibacter]MEB0263301.1 C4-type zinc ribbon domain-containing protein [Mucilaginibacter sp. 10I4]MEB0278292.1 C4-type zinc ribbon domain-containing protein [Mucilaginibacter sp. 10B2]MEB0301209.1 C4-type zinc ribbon domain-containing protein [Mucilaginibacter sp. 5C4]WPX23938.1 C4-type zinc ribbon domain-containing protein [Mucilaginibacter sp. 5C4]
MEQTIEQKLKALYDLQLIHTKIDKIRQVRGELPMEVADLEDDVAGLETRIQKIKNELDDLEDEIVTRKNLIKDSQANIKKYETQLNEVKNNREYDAISKEIEIQGLDIQVSEKKIREFGFEISSKTGIYEKALADLEARRSDLEAKKDELGTITAETEKEENELTGQAEKATATTDERLLIAYNRLRTNAKNGLAVVTIQRDSCSGCFNQIPPQRQSDIRQRKKIIVCEHCGRILVDELMALEEENA